MFEMSENQIKFIQCFYGLDEVNFDAIKILIEKGYEVNQLVEDLIWSMTKIDYNNVMSSVRFATLLVEQGLDINKIHPHRNSFMYSFVSAAIIYGNVDVIQYLIDAGAEINKVQGFAPVHIIAFTRGDKKLIYQVLKRAGGDFTLVDSFGQTPLENVTEDEREALLT